MSQENVEVVRRPSFYLVRGAHLDPLLSKELGVVVWLIVDAGGPREGDLG